MHMAQVVMMKIMEITKDVSMRTVGRNVRTSARDTKNMENMRVAITTTTEITTAVIMRMPMRVMTTTVQRLMP
jgi:hypothetical protein